MDNYLAGLRVDVWRTSGARYNAARRLRRRENVSVFSLALFSALSGALPFAQRVYAQSGSSLDNYLTTFSAALGIFLLAISLIEWGAKTGAVAEALHKNAEQLNALQRAIKLTLAVSSSSGTLVSPAEAAELSERYEQIKDSCPYNHSPVDDHYFRSKNRFSPEFAVSSGRPRMSWFRSLISGANWSLISLWYFAILWTIVLCAAFFAFFVNSSAGTGPDEQTSTAVSQVLITAKIR